VSRLDFRAGNHLAQPVGLGVRHDAEGAAGRVLSLLRVEDDIAQSFRDETLLGLSSCGFESTAERVELGEC